MWQTALLVAALITLYLVRSSPRACAWIGVSAVNFTITSAYAQMGMPYHPLFAGVFDSATCLLIYFCGKQRWEMLIWRLYQGSVLWIMIYLGAQLFGYTPSHYLFITGLEIVNWLVLLVVGTTTLTTRSDTDDVGVSSRFVRVFHRFNRALRAKRKKPSFIEAGW